MRLFYGSYEFPIMPAISVSITWDTVQETDSNGNVTEERQVKTETWDIEGALKAVGPQALITLWEALVEALEETEQDFIIKEDDGTEVYRIAAADCFEGPNAKNLDITEKRQALLVTNIRYRASIIAKIHPGSPDGSGILSRTSTLSFRYDILGFLTIIERGTVTFASPSPLRAPGPSIYPSPTHFTAESSFDFDNSRTVCDFSYTWKELKVPFPAALKDIIGEFTFSVTERSAPDFLSTEGTISGSCSLLKRGKIGTASRTMISGNTVQFGYSSGAASYIPHDGLDSVGDYAAKRIISFIENNLIGGDVRITSREITFDEWNQRISFTINFVMPGSTLSKLEYSMQVNHGDIIKTVKRYGLYPVFQYAGANASKLSETLEVQKIGSHPEIPMPIDHEGLEYEQDSYTIKKPSYDDRKMPVVCGISYNCSYFLQEDLSFNIDPFTLMRKRFAAIKFEGTLDSGGRR